MILNKRVKLPSYLTRTCHGILRGLLERNVERRLGCFKSTMFKKGGVDAIKMHPFFDGIDWNDLYAKKMRPPIVPDLEDNTDTKHFGDNFLSLPPRDTPKASSKKPLQSSPSSPLLLPSSACTPLTSPPDDDVSGLGDTFKRFSFTGPPTPMEDSSNRKSAIQEEGSDDMGSLKKKLVFDTEE